MAAEPDDRLALLTGENQLLERLAQGEELDSILDGICRMVEGIFRHSFVSIMLVNPDDHRLWYAASGSLPTAYTEALNGLEVGPSRGSCGAAAYRNAPVIVDDVLSDPLWAQYRDVAAQFGLRSCWSTPIRSADGRVIATFAVLSRQPGTPRLSISASLPRSHTWRALQSHTSATKAPCDGISRSFGRSSTRFLSSSSQ